MSVGAYGIERVKFHADYNSVSAQYYIMFNRGFTTKNIARKVKKQTLLK